MIEAKVLMQMNLTNSNSLLDLLEVAIKGQQGVCLVHSKLWVQCKVLREAKRMDLMKCPRDL